MLTKDIRCLSILIAVPLVWGVPLNHDVDRPLGAVSDLTAAVSELGSRVASRTARLQDRDRDRDPRLPLPTPQDLDAIKKVAQILIMLGEQVIPAITGEPPSRPAHPGCDPPQEIPNDPVDNN